MDINYTFSITVHIYAEEKRDDRALVLHSKNYGIVGKEIIAPLRKINGKEYCIRNAREAFTVKELWDRIDYKLYGSNLKSESSDTIRFVQEYNIVEKYLLVKDLRYKIEDEDRPLLYYLRKLQLSEKEKIDIQLLVNSDAGTIFEDDGIRYYMRSKESGKHSMPHVHVDVRHEAYGSFSLIDGVKLAGEGIKRKDIKKIEKMIERRKEELMGYWREHTDGFTVDLNQAWGLIQY